MLTPADDLKLAKALLARAERFACANNWHDALMDLSASYRLFIANSDPEAATAYEKWHDAYVRMEKQSAESENQKAFKLKALLRQIEQKRNR